MSEVEIKEDNVETAKEEHIVFIGGERFVSSYVNRGNLVEKNQIVLVGPVMAATLIRREFMNPKTSEMNPMWRRATPKEIDTYVNRFKNVDPDTADPALLAEAARIEALELGHVELDSARKEKEKYKDTGRKEPEPPKSLRRRRTKE